MYWFSGAQFAKELSYRPHAAIRNGRGGHKRGMRGLGERMADMKPREINFASIKR